MLFKRILLPTLLLVVCLLCACSSYSQTNSSFVGGVTVTPERLEEISKELAESEREADTQKEAVTTVNLSYKGKCYWVSGSKVFHVSDDCRYIRNSKDVKSDYADAAALDGCVRMCSACQKSIS